jgi:Fe2+ transport system protein FeoA
MGKVMHQKTTVLPGGKIEIIDIDLPVGESVEVVVSLPSVPAGEPIEVEVLNPLEGEPIEVEVLNPLEGEPIEVEVLNPLEGEPIEVEVRNPSESTRRSAVDILDEAPGHLLFKSAEEVDSYLREERASWND